MQGLGEFSLRTLLGFGASGVGFGFTEKKSRTRIGCFDPLSPIDAKPPTLNPKPSTLLSAGAQQSPKPVVSEA